MARAGRKPNNFFRPDFRDYILMEMFDGNVKRCRLTEGDKQKFEGLSWKYFDDQPLFENREVAKRMGVESPCTMPKDELLRHMIAERWGMQYLAKNGTILRPVNMDLVDAKIELELISDNVHGDVIMGEHFEGVFDGNELGGVLRVNKFIKSTGDVGVIRRLVNYHGIEAGDYITGWARFVPELNFFCLFCVESVNGMPVGLPSDKVTSERKKKRDEEYRKLVEKRKNLKTVAPCEIVTLPDEGREIALLVNAFTPFALGQSLTITSKNRFALLDAFFDLSDALNEAGIADEVITVCLEENVKREIVDDRKFVKTSLDDDQDSPAIVERVRTYAKGRAKDGKKTIILLSSIEKVGSDISAKKLFDTAKRYENGGSVTVVVFADSDNNGGYYYATRHLPNAELKIVTRPFLGDYTISVEECYATVEGILSGRDYAVRERLKEMLEDGGAESVTKFVRESKTYDGLVTRILDK